MNRTPDRWAEWQRDHAAALDALQEAQRAYHRVALNSPHPVGSRQSAAGGPPGVVNRQQSLEALDAARAKLDEIRARKPR